MTVFDLAAKISLDTSGYERGLDNARGQAQSFAGELKSAIGNVLNMGAAAVAVKKTAEAVIGGVKQSVTEFADTQQLIGGIETLYKDSADVIKGYAETAYKTAGMSANEYMDTATSFAATLISGLGGDTEAAASLVDMAITDMADNANKMGTDIGLIQNAYQGFAKQNYSMLDNLKLGYGGTQAEMYRLLQTAQSLDETFDAEFSMDPKGHLHAELADIIEAIHIIQEDFGIVGTTAQEAAGTISGSMASAKAAFSDFMSGLANPDADVGELFDRMVESAMVAKDNLIPAVKEVFANVGELAAEIGPQMLESGKAAINNLIEGFQSGDIQAAISEKLDGIAQKAQEVFGALNESLPAGLQGLVDKAGETFGAIGEYLGAVWLHIEPIVNAIKEELPGAIEAAKETFQTWLSGLTEGLTIALDTVKEVVSGAADLLKGDFDAALDHIQNAWGNLSEFFRNIADTIKSIFDGLVPWFTDVGTRMWEGLEAGLSKALSGVKELGGKIVDRFKDAFDINSPSRVMRDEVGLMLARGVAEGMDMGQRYVDAAVSRMIPTTSVDFAHSAIGKSSSASINASMLQPSQSGGSATINLVVDGKTLASVILDPLKATLRQKGEALA